MALHAQARSRRVPVLGVTGTGGAGKSSLTDELIRRLRLDQDDALRIAVISIDPSRRKSGGALLGRPDPHERDRSLGPGPAGLHAQPRHPRLRQRGQPRPARRGGRREGRRLRPRHRRDPRHRPGRRRHRAAGRRPDVRDDARSSARPASSRRSTCWTSRSSSRSTSSTARARLDALRDVAKQVQRNREAFGKRPDEMPVFGTMASRFNDDGVTALYQALKPRLARAGAAAEARAGCRRVDDPPQHAPDPARARRARALPGRDRRHGARLQAARAGAGALAREIQQLRASAAHAARGRRRTARRPPKAIERAGRGSARRGMDPAREEAAGAVAGRCSRPTRATSTS